MYFRLAETTFCIMMMIMIMMTMKIMTTILSTSCSEGNPLDENHDHGVNQPSIGV
jgi:hypothetical protein